MRVEVQSAQFIKTARELDINENKDEGFKRLVDEVVKNINELQKILNISQSLVSQFTTKMKNL